MNKNAFAGYHPVVQLIFFTPVMLFTMFIQHPVYLIITLLASLMTAISFGRRKALKVFLRFILPAALLVGVINPLFNHAGVTIMWYFPDGNPFTMESMIYGFVSGLMFSSIMLWCLCIRHTLSSDKILYLFGRVSPKISLLLSMILRFLPLFAKHFQEVRGAQHCIGRDVNQGNLLKRIRNTVRIISSVIEWSMENAVDTADALKSRGYGLHRRTSYSLYYFEARDGIMMTVTVLCSTITAVLYFTEQLDFYYYPVISPMTFEVQEISGYIVFCILCYLPLAAHWREEQKWKSIQSGI